MEVIEDFPEDSDMHIVEGILKVGSKPLEFEIKEGQILKFGKNESCFVNIPLDDIDNEQFLLTNYLGGLYLIDCSNNYPTRIKVEADKFYALN